MIYKLLYNQKFKLIGEFIGIIVGASIAAFAIEEFLVTCTILDSVPIE